jgi:hypothetical protein
MTAGDTAAVTYKTREFESPESPFHNVALGAFVTAYARRRMFRTLIAVPGRALYCDTDSVAVLRRPGLRNPEGVGRTLGKWKSELPPGAYIRRWQALGPKSYRYEYGPFFPNGPEGREEWRTVLKCKGIGKRPATTKALDGDAYEKLIEGRLEELSSFYDCLWEETPQGFREAVERVRRMFTEHRRLDYLTGDTTRSDGLLLPDPGLRRNVKTGKVWAETTGCKLVRYTADKRVFAPSAACLGMPSVPFGWRLGLPPSRDIRYDEAAFRFTTTG